MALLATALSTVAPLVISLSAGVEEEGHGGLNPYLVGAGTLAALLALLLALIAIGGGREHS